MIIWRVRCKPEQVRYPYSDLCSHPELWYSTPPPSLTVRMGEVPPSGTIPPSLITPEEPKQDAGQVQSVTTALSTTSAANRLSATAALMHLLLPDRQESIKQQSKVWIGSRLPPIPRKLYNRILKWEFINFYDFRPVDPLEETTVESDSVQYVMFPDLEISQANRKKVKDLQTWTACFALYVAVLASKFPKCVPSMMAYPLCILKANREYADPAWQVYDEAFREAAAATGLRDWSKSNDDLFSRIFTGRAKVVPLC